MTEKKQRFVPSLAAVARAFDRSDATIHQWKKKGDIVKTEEGYDIEAIALARGGLLNTKGHAEKLLDYSALKNLVGQYKTERADVLASEQAQNISIQKKIKELHLTDDKIRDLSENAAKAWFQALGVDFGIKFDKERLERGESTANVAVIVEAIKELKQKRFEGAKAVG